MSMKPCGNCKKTVYVNERMDVEGRWYHRGCFKCMAPDCNTALTLRTFQMTALDNSEIDPTTKRPLKVIVCKDHVAMPHRSLNADSLAFKHTTSAPKPAMSGLHRSMMGDRGSELKEGVVSSSSEKVGSPRSLDQGSHAEILKGIRETRDKKEDQGMEHEDVGRGHDADTGMGMEEEEKEKEKDDTEMRSMESATPLNFRQGRFTVTSVPAMAENARKHVTVASEEEEDSWDDSPNEDLEDHKQARIFTTKSDTGFKATPLEESQEEEVKPMSNASVNSRMMDHMKHSRSESKDIDADNDKTVDEDEWDAAPADEASRREVTAGI
ncbi:hypothetical protein BGZ98_001703 [Dissophora globulifera]|nr:hypothetical protein BGZ98_001703 [Dissophora globulifera]